MGGIRTCSRSPKTLDASRADFPISCEIGYERLLTTSPIVQDSTTFAGQKS